MSMLTKSNLTKDVLEAPALEVDPDAPHGLSVDGSHDVLLGSRPPGGAPCGSHTGGVSRKARHTWVLGTTGLLCHAAPQ